MESTVMLCVQRYTDYSVNDMVKILMKNEIRG